MNSVELFAGAGGLAMGASLAGFQPLAVVEWDKWACDTIRENQRRKYPVVADWPLWEGNVQEFDWASIPRDICLLAGGPPCQPFSMGGKHRAFGDCRDMFPTTIGIVRELRPKAFILENVKGLTRPSFSDYYQYVLLQLGLPEVQIRTRESWISHSKRLQRQKKSGSKVLTGLTYNVIPTVVNAADFGVPQRRERVFIVGFRADAAIEWSFPRPTHALDPLLYSQWISKEYWERHKIPQKRRPTIPERFAPRIRDLDRSLFPSFEQPWRTVRDALVDVPPPGQKQSDQSYFNHYFQDGARTYSGHTGSPLDLPAKTLKAGDHGVPGGENMMVLDNGRVRYFTVRESARLQTFPDGFVFHGSWTETMRQLGNAVPVALARKVASSVAEKIAEAELRSLTCGNGRIVA